MGLGSFISKAVDSVTGGDLLSFGGSLLGGAMQNNASAKAAGNANAMTEKMMKNRHQWETQDLINAGLNPILSANAAPSMGSSAVADVPSNPLGDASAKVLQSKMMNEQIKNMQADTRQKQSSTDLNDNLGAKTFEERKLVKINQAIAMSNSASAAAQAQIAAAGVAGAQNESQYQKDVGKWAPWLRNTVNVAKDIFGTANSAKALAK